MWSLLLLPLAGTSALVGCQHGLQRAMLSPPRRGALLLEAAGGNGDGEAGGDGNGEATLDGSIGLAPLASNLGVQALYAAVAAFGVTFLLAPFGGPTPVALLGVAAPWHAYDGALDAIAPPAAEAALGAGVALAELMRLGVLDDAEQSLDYTPAQALQMRPLYEIAGAEPSLPAAIAAISAWQLSIALAEELYYRGFIESVGVLAISWPLRDAGAAAGPALLALVEGLPLLVSAVLFGLVHAEFVEGAGEGAGAGASNADGVEDSKSYWFRVTAAYSVLYSALYVVSGHRVLAPVFCHAGLNVGLCVRDWKRMRRSPAGMLERVFRAVDGRDTFGLE